MSPLPRAGMACEEDILLAFEVFHGFGIPGGLTRNMNALSLTEVTHEWTAAGKLFTYLCNWSLRVGHRHPGTSV